MRHPVDLAQLLKGLGPDRLEALGHILDCHDCALKTQQLLSSEPAGAESLSAQEMTLLESLTEQIRRDVEAVSHFVGSLEPKRARAHQLVRSRLECVVADHLSPAVRDLESIEETARGNLDAGVDR
jgi:hypothetical protein